MEKYYADPTGRVRVRGKEMWTQLDQELTAALRVLGGFSYLNVLWWFSDSDNEEMHSVLETSQSYKSTPETMGIFITRSPIRPDSTVLIVVGVLSIDHEAGMVRIVHIDANDDTSVLDTKPYTPSLDRVQNPVVPRRCGNWPSSLRELREFDWELIFNFQYGSR